MAVMGVTEKTLGPAAGAVTVAALLFTPPK